MDKDYFQFKSFRLRNRDSALRINSDGVLLAAWAELSAYDKVLDIGTGGGVIAFVLKHRFPNIKVHGIDIDKPSIEEAKYNLAINNWDNLSFQVSSLQEYGRSYARNTYDHIISNPPFHVEQAQCNSRLDLAKHTTELSFSELINVSSSLLSFVGRLSIIVPYDQENEIDKLAASEGLFKSRVTRVAGKEGGEPKRSLLEYCKRSTGEISLTQFHIRSKEGGDASFGADYMALTKDLYINF